VTVKFVMLLLRLATTDEVKSAVRTWYEEAVKTGVSDPRAEALYALLFFVLPRAAGGALGARRAARPNRDAGGDRAAHCTGACGRVWALAAPCCS
jgi:hypothetical protein